MSNSLETLTVEAFQPRVGERFRIRRVAGCAPTSWDEPIEPATRRIREDVE